MQVAKAIGHSIILFDFAYKNYYEFDVAVTTDCLLLAIQPPTDDPADRWHATMLQLVPSPALSEATLTAAGLPAGPSTRLLVGSCLSSSVRRRIMCDGTWTPAHWESTRPDLKPPAAYSPGEFFPRLGAPVQEEERTYSRGTAVTAIIRRASGLLIAEDPGGGEPAHGVRAVGATFSEILPIISPGLERTPLRDADVHELAKYLVNAHRLKRQPGSDYSAFSPEPPLLQEAAATSGASRMQTPGVVPRPAASSAHTVPDARAPADSGWFFSPPALLSMLISSAFFSADSCTLSLFWSVLRDWSLLEPFFMEPAEPDASAPSIFEMACV